jgi:hypothetical protein
LLLIGWLVRLAWLFVLVKRELELSSACALCFCACAAGLTGYMAWDGMDGWMARRKNPPSPDARQLLFRKIGRDSINCNLHVGLIKSVVCCSFVRPSAQCARGVLPWMLTLHGARVIDLPESGADA